MQAKRLIAGVSQEDPSCGSVRLFGYLKGGLSYCEHDEMLCPGRAPRGDKQLRPSDWGTEKLNIFSKISGAQGRNRTTDTAIFSRMLYQLSYLGIRCAAKPCASWRGV